MDETHINNNSIVFIVNPISGVGNKKTLLSTVKSYMEKENLPYKLFFTRDRDDAREQAANFAAQGVKKVIAIGGDGTVNEVARGLVHTDTCMGIIPAGSGNGLARHCRIPMNTKGALEIAIHGQQIKMDCGTINGKYFFCTAGVGFDALVGNKFAVAPRRGPLSYALITGKEYLHYTPQNYKITINGETIERTAFLITFANASQWGNNAYIAPYANVCDGLQDVVVVSSLPFFRIADFGIQVFSKQVHKSGLVEIFRCREVTVERETPGYIHYDGEPYIDTEIIEVKTIPGALNIITNNL